MGSKHYWSRLPCILADQACFPQESKEGLTGSRGSNTADSTASADFHGDSPEWKASDSGGRGSVATACARETRREERIPSSTRISRGASESVLSERCGTVDRVLMTVFLDRPF